jgi:hypothetical protein
MRFENASRCIHRRRLREGRMDPRARVPSLFRPRTPQETGFTSRVVSRLLIRDGADR